MAVCRLRKNVPYLHHEADNSQRGAREDHNPKRISEHVKAPSRTSNPGRVLARVTCAARQSQFWRIVIG